MLEKWISQQLVMLIMRKKIIVIAKSEHSAKEPSVCTVDLAVDLTKSIAS